MKERITLSIFVLVRKYSQSLLAQTSRTNRFVAICCLGLIVALVRRKPQKVGSKTKSRPQGSAEVFILALIYEGADYAALFRFGAKQHVQFCKAKLRASRRFGTAQPRPSKRKTVPLWVRFIAAQTLEGADYAALFRFGAKQHVQFCRAKLRASRRFGTAQLRKVGFQNKKQTTRVCFLFWSGLRGSNPPPPPWQGGALP
ncbi:MAG: hypothetical protein IKJ25_06555, partial [Clostridia bacterium]|nr:hypothetical protein [Clostridia bacterium]